MFTLFFHGKNFWGAYWDETIAALTAAGYRVVVPDQIGFGRSSKPNIHYSFDLLAANTAKLLDTLGVREAALVGHSTGGMIAVRFARNYPERTTRLILENPIGLEDYRLKVPPRTIEQLYESELSQTEEKIRAYFKSYFVEWKPERYHDTYTEELRERIRAKESGKDIVEAEEPKTPANVTDLTEALQASLEASRKPRRRTRKAS